MLLKVWDMNASSLHQIGNSPIVSLGDYITECDERNDKGNYGIDDVRGISIQKKLIDTKADMTGVSLSPYKVLKPREFCYVTVTSRNGGKISLAINDEQKTFIVSSSYITFKSKDNNVLLPEYLFLLLNRPEFDRYSRFNSWGSARETFDWSELCRTKVPLPSIETQRELVAVCNGLKKLAEENEALLQPLKNSCQAFIADCAKKHQTKPLGNYIEQRREKNKYENVPIRGVTREGFIEPKQDGDLSMYNVFYRNDFVFNPARMEINSIALNTEYNIAICSSLYEVFYVKDTDILLPEFLNLFIKRDEFARYCWFDAIGSARNYYRVNNISQVKVPLPPIEIQRTIVNLSRCYEEAKQIASQAREQLKTICPALIQKAAHSA